MKKAPAAAVGETDVLKADEEGRAVREGDGGGCVVRADEAGGAHAGGADMGEIVDRCPHEREITPERGEGKSYNWTWCFMLI